MSAYTPGPNNSMEEWFPSRPQNVCRCEVYYQPSSIAGMERDVISYCPLHAAAPEMLEALESLLGRIDEHFGDAHDHTGEWKEQSQARAAIAKAKGEGK